MKNKFKMIIWPIIYLVLILNVCISFILVFRSYYFRSIFVFGSSMQPTLNGVGERVDYGIIDDHKNAIDNLKRFQIVTTYYPFPNSNDYVGGYKHGEKNVINEEDASYKIKRVYGFPAETIRFEVDLELYATIENAKDDEMSKEQKQETAQKCIKFFSKKTGDLQFVEHPIKFKRNIDISKIPSYNNFEYQLGEDEYWVMGDNYSTSSDCFSQIPKQPIYYDNIVGVLIAIEGTCKISNNTDPGQEGTKKSYKCTERKRHFPVFY